MTEKTYNKGRAEYHWKAEASLEVTKSASLAPGQEMEPLRLAYLAPADYRIRNGWPQPVPDFDVRPTISFSVTGSVTSDRPLPSMITTNAHSRWIAGVNYTTDWDSAQGAAATLAGTMPTLVADLPYRVKREQLLRDAAVFQSGNSNYLLSSGLPDSAEFTWIMVLSVNESLNTIDDETVDEEIAGLVCPNTSGAWNPSVHMRSGRISIQVHPDRSFESLPKSSLFRMRSLAQPFFMSFAVGKPGVRVWFGNNPKNLTGFRVEYPYTDHDQSNQHLIGVDSGLLNYANMSLFDISYYDERLDRYAVAKEFKKLAKSYGGN